MSVVTGNQPDGIPTWIDLGIPDLERAMAFYGALFGRDFEVGPPEAGRSTRCLLGGRRVAALVPNPDPQATTFEVADTDAVVARAAEGGGVPGPPRTSSTAAWPPSPTRSGPSSR